MSGAREGRDMGGQRDGGKVEDEGLATEWMALVEPDGSDEVRQAA